MTGLLLIVLSFSFLKNAASVGFVSEYILSSGVTGDCGEMITSKESVFVKSHVGAGMYGGLTSYSANTDCDVAFRAESGQKILVNFPFFDLQAPDGVTCIDRLQFYESPDGITTTPTLSPSTTVTTTAATASTSATATTATTVTTVTTTAVPTTTTAAPTTTASTTGTTVTGTTNNVTTVTSITTTVVPTTTGAPELFDTICVKPGPYVTTSNELAVRFITDGTVQRKGFSLLLTSFHEGTCTASEFQCDTNRCISDTLKCDGVNHCIDESDESEDIAMCSTLDKVIGKVTSLGSLAVLAIGVTIIIIIFTVATVIILWKYISGKESCTSAVEPEESERITEVKVIKQGPKSAPPKPPPAKKKSVTIGITGAPVETVKKPVVGKGKVTKVKQAPVDDDDW